MFSFLFSANSEGKNKTKPRQTLMSLALMTVRVMVEEIFNGQIPGHLQKDLKQLKEVVIVFLQKICKGCTLPHFLRMLYFYNPENRKSYSFRMFSGGIEVNRKKYVNFVFYSCTMKKLLFLSCYSLYPPLSQISIFIAALRDHFFATLQQVCQLRLSAQKILFSMSDNIFSSSFDVRRKFLSLSRFEYQSHFVHSPFTTTTPSRHVLAQS